MAALPFPRVPRPTLRVVENLTDFRSFQCDKMGPGRTFCDTVVLKASYALTPGVLTPVAPAPITLADAPWDLASATRSSLRAPGDLLLGKPSTDVMVTGSVRTPDGAPAREWVAAISVHQGDQRVAGYAARVTGPRVWRRQALRGFVLDAPEPAAEVPIRYELAYGGAYARDERWITDEENPSGTGFFDPDALSREPVLRAPQWEDLDAPIRGPNEGAGLAGFGPIARPWRSRLRYAGTYDAAWRARADEDARVGIAVDYPSDFDYRFFQYAHPQLIARSYLRGDETLMLSGMLPGAGVFTTRLPGIAVIARLYASRMWRDQLVPLDTVLVDLDAKRVDLTFRLTLDRARGVLAAVLYDTDPSTPEVQS